MDDVSYRRSEFNFRVPSNYWVPNTLGVTANYSKVPKFQNGAGRSIAPRA